MKTKRFRLLSVILTIVMLLAVSLNVYAASSNAVTLDGITSQLFTDKNVYKAGEAVQASVQVDRTGREVYIYTQINVPNRQSCCLCRYGIYIRQYRFSMESVILKK